MSVLFTLDDFTKVEKVKMPWAGTSYFIPAGTPMSETGIANDESAIGILAENAYLKYEYDWGTNPIGKVEFEYPIIKSGYINTADAEDSFGGKYSDACRTALKDIVFCDGGKLPTGGGGGGGIDGVVIVNAVMSPETGEITPDKTFDELSPIYLQGVDIVLLRLGNVLLECTGATDSDIYFSKFTLANVSNESADATSIFVELHNDNTVSFDITPFTFDIIPKN